MHLDVSHGDVLAMSKHQLAGTVAVVVGALLVAIGVARIFIRAATGALVPLLGVAAVVVGILFFTRTF